MSGNIAGPGKEILMPNLSIADRLSALPKLKRSALCKLWQELFRADPPPELRKELMVQFLAYRMQEEEFGGLSNASHRRIRDISCSLEAHSNPSASPRQTVKPGTRLLRQWQDQVHVVNVEEESYEYRGARYESLSEIARLITGTRWSGPLFFGLKNKPIKNATEAA
jgi:hypothetical protein